MHAHIDDDNIKHSKLYEDKTFQHLKTQRNAASRFQLRSNKGPLRYFIPSILLKLGVYIFMLILLMFPYSLNNTTTLRHLSY